jgi:hypothetical protein
MRLQVAAGALAPEAQTRGEGHPKAHRLGRRIFTQSLPERASKPHQALHELYQDRLKLYRELTVKGARKVANGDELEA